MAITPYLLMGIVLLVAVLAGTTYALIRQRKYVQSLQAERQVVIEKLNNNPEKTRLCFSIDCPVRSGNSGRCDYQGSTKYLQINDWSDGSDIYSTR